MIGDIIHKPEEESGKEKHVPYIEKIDENTVKVSCGKDIMHPSTDSHYIAWINLYGIDGDGKPIQLGSYSPVGGKSQPVAYFTVSEIGNYKKLTALIYCNLHGFWENSLEL